MLTFREDHVIVKYSKVHPLHLIQKSGLNSCCGEAIVSAQLNGCYSIIIALRSLSTEYVIGIHFTCKASEYWSRLLNVILLVGACV